MKQIIIGFILGFSLLGVLTRANDTECVCKIKNESIKEQKEHPKITFCKEQGQTDEFCNSLLTACYNTDDPKNCFGVGLAINFNETSFKSYSFGMKKNDNFNGFVKNYNKYWYTNKYDMGFFYGKNGITGKSRYCTEEYSSNTNGWCPNGLKNSTFMLKKYLNKF